MAAAMRVEGVASQKVIVTGMGVNRYMIYMLTARRPPEGTRAASQAGSRRLAETGRNATGAAGTDRTRQEPVQLPFAYALWPSRSYPPDPGIAPGQQDAELMTLVV